MEAVSIAYLIELAKRAYADGHDAALPVLMRLVEQERELPRGPLPQALSLLPDWLCTLWYTHYCFGLDRPDGC
jgi:hypothetical protein